MSGMYGFTGMYGMYYHWYGFNFVACMASTVWLQRAFLFALLRGRRLTYSKCRDARSQYRTRACMASTGTCMASTCACMASTASCMASTGTCMASTGICMASKTYAYDITVAFLPFFATGWAPPPTHCKREVGLVGPLLRRNLRQEAGLCQNLLHFEGGLGHFWAILLKLSGGRVADQWRTSGGRVADEPACTHRRPTVSGGRVADKWRTSGGQTACTHRGWRTSGGQVADKWRTSGGRTGLHPPWVADEWRISGG